MNTNLVTAGQQPASVATLAFLTQVVFEYGNCQELSLEPIHFCRSKPTTIIEMLRLLTPQGMTRDDEDLSVFPGRRILRLAGSLGSLGGSGPGSWEAGVM